MLEVVKKVIGGQNFIALGIYVVRFYGLRIVSVDVFRDVGGGAGVRVLEKSEV